MKNQMPAMPSLSTNAQPPASSSPESVKDSGLSPSFAEVSVEKSAETAEVEIEEFETPKIADAVQISNHATKAVAPLRRGIKVVAADKGFYNQMRLEPGNEFTIRSEEDFGEWFRCVDMVMEQKRIDFLKAKKKKVKE